MSEEFVKEEVRGNKSLTDLSFVFGPCSAESEEQVMKVASVVAENYPHAVFRSGIWKPRTRPGNFEGIGSIGLNWLNKIQKELGLKVATEVANVEHVELALKHNIDVLWLGARTTVNPFYVQEIADAIKGNDVAVYIKNPVVPDLPLWMGAIERIEKVGVTEIKAIHRGFHHHESAPYRNKPLWEIPISLMSQRPEIPVICDISHIGGNPELFPTLAQKAMDLNMAGLHVEVHPEPTKALSDAKQQITPTQLLELLNHVEFRQGSIDDPDFQKVMKSIRNEIDDIDEALLKTIHKRMELVKRIGALKKENSVTILQVERWKSITLRYLSEGKALGLSQEFVMNLLNNIHDESMRNQNKIMND